VLTVVPTLGSALRVRTPNKGELLTVNIYLVYNNNMHLLRLEATPLAFDLHMSAHQVHKYMVLLYPMLQEIRSKTYVQHKLNIG
jgi:hypothetical protein